jgi:hypothetical protein
MRLYFITNTFFIINTFMNYDYKKKLSEFPKKFLKFTKEKKILRFFANK